VRTSEGPAIASPTTQFPTVESLGEALERAGYIATGGLTRTIWLAMRLGRPLLIEGTPGNGKTELAKALAEASGARLIRLQCYEGLDESRILYEWDHRKQLLRIQASLEGTSADGPFEWGSLAVDLFSKGFLLTRPLLEAVTGEGPVLLLVDSVDLMTAEAEALLLEALSDFTVSIPEIGTVRASRPPLVVLTSNSSRDLSIPMRRRCIVAHISHPTAAAELDLTERWLPGIGERVGRRIDHAVANLDATLGPRGADKREWAATLRALSAGRGTEASSAGSPSRAGSGVSGGPQIEERGQSVLAYLQELVHELRAAGVPVSVAEKLDALRAVDAVPLESRDLLRSVLAATLVKNSSHLATFETLFDVFFALRAVAGSDSSGASDPAVGLSGRVGSRLTEAELADSLFRCLFDGDRALMRALARESVRRYADIRPGRAMRGLYYAFRTLRSLGLSGIVERLVEAATEEATTPLTSLELRLATDEFTSRVDAFRKEVEAEIRRRLVASQGAAALGAAARKPLPEDLDFLEADAAALEDFRTLLKPLTAQLAVRIRSKRAHGVRGSVDFRRTIRRSMSTGGVPLDLCWRRPSPNKGEVVVIADMSASVASFARFTVMLIQAMSSQFRRIRTFAFVDDIDEITGLFRAATDMQELVDLINSEARLTWFDGHSDYGRIFEEFLARWGNQLTPTTTVLILGDGRNNYRASRAPTIGDMAKRCRRIIWLNPEPSSNWNSGDSVVGEYAAHCDGVYECRNVRQLATFVERVL
jgi:hypothetical protein